jgi:hypothetical protein
VSGRALIIVVTGIIVITSVILYNIGASSTRITANFNDYFLRQTTQNIAQSGVNLCLRKLSNDPLWRTNSWTVDLFGGKAYMRVRDTSYGGITNAIAVRSIGVTQRSLSAQRMDTSIAYIFFPPSSFPTGIRGLLTLNASNSVSLVGSITIDGRDHDSLGNVVPDSGTYGVWNTGPTFNTTGSSTVGGTVNYIDYAPSGASPNPAILLNQTLPPPGYPTTPDSVLGGESNGFPEGMLKSMAQAGAHGSQYSTNPATLTYPLSGVTYVEMPVGSPQWSPANLQGSGILVVHNAATNAKLYNTTATFKGIIITDDVAHLHGDTYGALVVLSRTPTGNALGNGNAAVLYSNYAIRYAMSLAQSGSSPVILGWWE